MKVDPNFKLQDFIMTEAGFQYRENALKAELNSLPDSPEKTYYELELKRDEIALMIEKDPANANLSPKEMQDKIFDATQSILQQMHLLREENPYACTKWSLPTNPNDYINISV